MVAAEGTSGEITFHEVVGLSEEITGVRANGGGRGHGSNGKGAGFFATKLVVVLIYLNLVQMLEKR